MKKESTSNKHLRVWTRFESISTDPLDYDLEVHHIMMRSVFASLVSNYKNGAFEPQIAKSWSSDVNHTEWTMNIDNQWTFDNGEKVTTDIVLKSIKRVLLIKNKTKSKSGLLEFLDEAEKLKTIEDQIEGLKVQGDSIKFKFVKPIPDFLEKISFGIYAIVHPSNYLADGTWIDKKNAIFSGCYKITKWEKGKFELELRDNLKINHIESSKKIKKVEFNFENTPNYEKLDLVIREKYNPSIEKYDWRFGSATQDSSIVYIKVMNWDNKSSKFSNRSFREKLRNIYYEKLLEEGLDVTTSFFPLAIKGVQTFDYKHGYKLNLNGEKLRTQPFFFNPEVKYEKKELGRIFNDAFLKLNASINATATNVDYPENESDEKNVFDIQFLGTGILIDDPLDDIKFMFLSKHGIQLPDETGEIISELKKENINVQLINKLLWDQAIIWPVRHYSTGFWINNNSEIDVSEINLTKQPIDFQFVRWK